MSSARLRALKVLGIFVAATALFSEVLAARARWVEPVILALYGGAMTFLSVRAVLAKWRADDASDVTKHGPTAVLPDRWRRWYYDVK